MKISSIFLFFRCQKEAMTSFHKYECRLTHVFQQTGILKKKFFNNFYFQLVNKRIIKCETKDVF